MTPLDLNRVNRILIVFTSDAAFDFHMPLVKALGREKADILLFCEQLSHSKALVELDASGYRIVGRQAFAESFYAAALVQTHEYFSLEQDWRAPKFPLIELRKHANRIVQVLHTTDEPAFVGGLSDSFLLHHEGQAMATARAYAGRLERFVKIDAALTNASQNEIAFLSELGRYGAIVLGAGAEIGRVLEALKRLPRNRSWVIKPHPTSTLSALELPDHVRVCPAELSGADLIAQAELVMCDRAGLVPLEAIFARKRVILVEGSAPRARLDSLLQDLTVDASWNDVERVVELASKNSCSQSDILRSPICEMEVAYSGSYHIESAHSRILTRDEAISEAEAAHSIHIPRDRPILVHFCYVSDLIEQFAPTLRELAKHCTVVVKWHSGDASGKERLEEALCDTCILPKIDSMKYVPNALRYAADVILASPESSTFTTGLLANRRVIPVMTDQALGDPPVVTPLREYLGPNPMAHLPVVGELGGVNHFQEIEKIRGMVFDETRWRWYDRELEGIKKRTFGRYRIDGAAEEGARLLTRLIDEGTFGRDNVAPRNPREALLMLRGKV